MNNMRLFLFLCVSGALLLSSCSEDSKQIQTIEYTDTSEFLLETSETSKFEILANGKIFEVINEKVFPDTSLLKPVFRIPSIILTNSGTMLVATENRSSIYDNSDEMDILVSRKSINDSKWSVRRVWKNSPLYGRSMNPIFVIDRSGKFSKKDRIYLFTCHIKCEKYDMFANYDQVDMVYKYSDDDGITWSSESSVKEFWDTLKYTAVIPSCANGIQLDDGMLIIPTMVIDKGHYRSGIAYCAPNGNWCFSNPSPNIDDNESTVYQDNNGNIILDCRTVEKVRRKYVYDMRLDSWQLIPGSFNNTLDLKAEITKCNIDGKIVYLMTYCDTPNETRQNITLWGSLDGAQWKKICRVQEGECHFAYSNVSSYKDKIALVYETQYNGTIVLDISLLKQDILDVLF